MTLDTLISPAYVAEQRRLHAQPRGYGQRGNKWSTQVMTIAWTHNCESILDYGCGQGSLGEALRLSERWEDIREYDPAIPGKDALPMRADLVVCTDVMEHVEPEKLEAVLRHLTSLADAVLFVVVSIVETAKTLSDGRQAHILLRSPEWWRTRFHALGWVVEELPIKPEKQWVAILTRAQA